MPDRSLLTLRVRPRLLLAREARRTVFEKNYRLQDIQLSKSADDEIRGGEYRARTGDLLVANQALSQLS